MLNKTSPLKKESDKAMLLRIQKKRKTIVEAFEPSVSAANEARYLRLIKVKEIHINLNNGRYQIQWLEQCLRLMNFSSLGIVAPPSVSMQTDDESWADDPNDSDDEATTTSNDSSDEDESSMGKIGKWYTLFQTKNSYIFGKSVSVQCVFIHPRNQKA